MRQASNALTKPQGGDIRQTSNRGMCFYFYSVLNPHACLLFEYSRPSTSRMLVEYAWSPRLAVLFEYARSPRSRMLVEHAQSCRTQTRTSQDASFKPSNLARGALQARYGSRAFRPNLEGPTPYDHEGTCGKLLGPSPNPSTKGGDTRQTSKTLKDMFLLLQCSGSANVRNNIVCCCVCIEPFRRASRVFTQLILLCERFHSPSRKVV